MLRLLLICLCLQVFPIPTIHGQTLQVEDVVRYINGLLREQRATVQESDGKLVTLNYTISVDEHYDITVSIRKSNGQWVSENTFDPRLLAIRQVYILETHDALVLHCAGRTDCIIKCVSPTHYYYTPFLKLALLPSRRQTKNLQSAFIALLTATANGKYWLNK